MSVSFAVRSFQCWQRNELVGRELKETANGIETNYSELFEGDVESKSQNDNSFAVSFNSRPNPRQLSQVA